MVCCCVPFCKSQKGKTKNISYHEFPCDLELRNKWIKNISRENLIINDKSGSTVVCSIHFHPSDYILNGKYKRLKKNSVPTIFPGYPSYKIPKVTSPRRELKRISVDAKQNSTKRKYRKNKNTLKPIIIQLSSKDNFTEREMQTAFDLPGELIKQRKEIAMLKKKLCAQNEMLEKKKTAIATLSEELQRYNNNKLYQILNSVINEKSNRSNFLLEQLLNYNNDRSAWSSETIRECILWNLASPKCYSIMRKRNFVKLPNRTTLLRYEKKRGITSIIKEGLTAECDQPNDTQ